MEGYTYNNRKPQILSIESLIEANGMVVMMAMLINLYLYFIGFINDRK